jgi:molybdopterin synthase catalytic subunit
MQLSVHLFAGLRDRAGSQSLILEDVPEGSTLGDIKRLLAQQHPKVGDLSSVAGVIGDAYAPDSTPIRAGDQVALLPPVSGGQGSAAELERSFCAGVFELSREALDVQALEQRVVSPRCGALVTFLGTTRDTHKGERVLRLEYEAFEAMTGPEMGRIFGDCLSQLGESPGGPARMLCVHRTGTVGVAEPSVLISVAAPHRAYAFDLCRLLIDELKARLPIWKREVLSSGAHWVGDRS